MNSKLMLHVALPSFQNCLQMADKEQRKGIDKEQNDAVEDSETPSSLESFVTDHYKRQKVLRCNRNRFE